MELLSDTLIDELCFHILQGIKIKMDDAGNILVRRYGKSNVFIKSSTGTLNEETAIGSEVLKSPNQCLEIEKVYKVRSMAFDCFTNLLIKHKISSIFKIFDMKKFQSNVNRELSRAYPDRRRLETQCLSIISLVKSENDVLECPIWVMIINVVAMDMLKTKLPPGKSLSIIMQIFRHKISKRSLLRNYRSPTKRPIQSNIRFFLFMIFCCFFHSPNIMI